MQNGQSSGPVTGPPPPAAGPKRHRTSNGAVAAGASTSDSLVPAVQADLQAVADKQLQVIKPLARVYFKTQKKHNRFTALRAANKVPNTLRGQLFGTFKFRCPDKTVRETTQAAINTLKTSFAEAVFKEMADGFKDANDAAKSALDTAVAAASVNLQASFNTLRQQQSHGSTDPRMQKTFRHVQVDMEAAIARLLIQMRDSIVGRPPPPPPPPAPAAAAGGGPSGAAGAGQAAPMDADNPGPLNQEGLGDQQAAAAPILTKAEVEQLIAATVQKIVHKSKPAQPKQRQRQQAQQQQPPRRNQHQGRQFVVLQNPRYQGYVNKPGQQRFIQGLRPPPPMRQPRYNHQQQQQFKQPALFHQGPPGFRGYPSPNNNAAPGGQPIRGPAIPRGRNGGRRNTMNGYGTTGDWPGQGRRRHYN